MLRGHHLIGDVEKALPPIAKPDVFEPVPFDIPARYR